ncbi:basic proline-rich protein-like [Lolium rigidum]|uniref:basic proline-rich protein-like n=1 Tax=Lolium rigidum TaxID=89674 RepID=UPI001F5D392E|nr:basic proline-rich protein-like [Lolium rigidum]
MVSMAAAADHNHHRHRLANPASPPSGPPAPAPPPPQPHRRRLHSFSFPTLSWGTHRLLRCAKNPASSPPPAAPDTPSPDKENARPPADGSTQQRPPQRPWNLRTRRSATVAPRAFGTSHDAPDAAAAPDPARHPDTTSKRGFSVVLSKEEIADDFALFRGTRPPRRPKKRPRTLQRQIDSMCPGFCLADVTPDTYKIEER